MKHQKFIRYLAGLLAGVFLLNVSPKCTGPVWADTLRSQSNAAEKTTEEMSETPDAVVSEAGLTDISTEDPAGAAEEETDDLLTGVSGEESDVLTAATADEPAEQAADLQEESVSLSSVADEYGLQFTIGNAGTSTVGTAQTGISMVEAEKTVKITFSANGGSGTRKAQVLPCGTAAMLRRNDPVSGDGFTMKDCIFAGWNTRQDGSGTTIQDGGAFLADCDTRLYAMWVEKVSACSVVFHANGGAEEDYARTYTSGSGSLEKGIFTRKNYTFAGWNTEASGKGTNLADGAALSRVFRLKKSSLQLYAKWEPVKFSIRYELNGGTNAAANPNRYAYGQTVQPVAAARKGYLFAGWYTDKSLKNKVTEITEGNLVLYAKWKPITYTVSFSANGGSGTMKKMSSCTYGTGYHLTGNTFTRKGYAFAGWNTDPKGKGKAFKNAGYFKNLLSKNKGSLTLYAQWNKIYRITYRCNGGSLQKSAKKTFTVATASFVLPGAVRTGYSFLGWYQEKKLKTKVTAVNRGSTGNRTYYAKWKAHSYVLKFRGNGSTGGSMAAVQSRKHSYGSAFTLPSNRYSREDYSFAGWNTKADGSGTNYSDGAKVKNLTAKNGAVVTLYAQWKPDKKLIPLHTEEGYRAGNISGSYAGGAFASNGCGPAACGIISGEHPLSVGAWMMANGEAGYGEGGKGGTNPTGITRYFQAHGYEVGRPGTYQEWYSRMATGKYYGICLMTAASPYTNGGHYVVVSDVSPAYGCYVYDATWSGRDGWSGQRFGVLSFDGMSSAWWLIPKYR